MWVELIQRMAGWFGAGGTVTTGTRVEDFRVSEPVFNELTMSDSSKAGVQVGQVNGSVRVVHLKQERHITNHVHVYGEPDPASKSLTSSEQRDVLQMIRALRNSDSTFAFMEKTFGTKFVMDLQPSQLLRVRRYVESINKRTGNRGRSNS